MKYRIKMSCGHEDVVDLDGKGSDRERKIKYFESFGLCKECYKMKKRKEDEAMGLVFRMNVLTRIDEDDGGLLLFVWFEGDTWPHKDEIRSLGGYTWTQRESAMDMDDGPRCWGKTIKLESLETETEKAKSIGAKCIVKLKGSAEIEDYEIALRKRKAWMERRAEIEKIEKPHVPEVLQGHRWNQTVYGRSGNYSVYLDGEKVSLTDEQTEEIKDYVAKKEEYAKKVEEIEHGNL